MTENHASTNSASVEIWVQLHNEPEGWWAESDALPWWSAAGETQEELLGLVAEAMRMHKPGQGWGWMYIRPTVTESGWRNG